MISPIEEEYIKRYAYVPEHIPGYVRAISGGEPFLLDDYLCYAGKDLLIFVGYPLTAGFDIEKIKEILKAAHQRFKPGQVALICQSLSSKAGKQREWLDVYYKLDLANFTIRPKLKNMIHRAAKELEVEKGRELKREHQDLIGEFFKSHSVAEGTRYIFQKIPEYLSSVPTAWVFSARDRSGQMAGFAIAEFSAQKYAFYMFNFRSRKRSTPGTSDLLLLELIKSAQDQGKLFINLGLGVNAGVAFFKRKWGGLPFLTHQFILYQPDRPAPLSAFLRSLLRL